MRTRAHPAVAAAIYFILPFVLLAIVWEAVVAAGLVDAFLISRPSDIAAAFVQLIGDGELVRGLRPTLLALVMAFTLATVVGVAVGVLLGWYRKLGDAFEPYVWFIYSAPVISLYPVFVVSLGLGTATVITIAFLLTISPVVVNTMRGVRDVSPVLVRAARSFGANDPQVFMRVALPGAVPMIMAGLRIGVGRSLTGVIVAEMFAAEVGLGFELTYYSQTLRTPETIATIIVISLVGLAATYLLRAAEQKVDSWRVDPST